MKLFVYGSLMSRSVLERVLGCAYNGEFRRYSLPGHRRDWSASENGLAYLNVVVDSASTVEGFILELDRAHLARLDEWEPTYERVHIGDVETYVCRPEFRNKGAAVLRSYWQLVQATLGQALPELPGHLTMTDEA
jgi:gamma-glutamylcyclotransferase (GGCT)/AIG2-like uncharacterized protein YtfP